MPERQLSLWGPPRPPRRAFDGAETVPGKAETSVAAAASIDDEAARGQEQQILDALLARGEHGATRQELVELTGVAEKSVCPRVDRLLKKRLVTKSGKRQTKSGRTADVLVAVGRA